MDHRFFKWKMLRVSGPHDEKLLSMVSLGTRSRLFGNQLQDDGSSACVLSLAYMVSSQPS